MLPKQNVRSTLSSIFTTALMGPLLLLLATGCSIGGNDDNDRREWRQDQRERQQDRREEKQERKQEKLERQQEKQRQQRD